MYVIIDNYDSFTHNLYQYLRELTDIPVEVFRNDRLTVDELAGDEAVGHRHLPGTGQAGRGRHQRRADPSASRARCPSSASASATRPSRRLSGDGSSPPGGSCTARRRTSAWTAAGCSAASRARRGSPATIPWRSSGNRFPRSWRSPRSPPTGRSWASATASSSSRASSSTPSPSPRSTARRCLRNFLSYRREPFPLSTILAGLQNDRSMTREEAEFFMDELTDGRLTDAQIAGVLASMTGPCITAQALAGFAAVLRRKKRPFASDRRVLDTCGTGGDGLGTFNISSLAAVVAASCGALVAKHGNRGASSPVGSADFFRELGVAVDAPPRAAEDLLREEGFCFLFAPVYHGAMRHAARARTELGIRSAMNLVGPLSNPADASYQLIGVFDEQFCGPVAEAAHLLGVRRVMAVHGEDGLDEISVCGAHHGRGGRRDRPAKRLHPHPGRVRRSPLPGGGAARRNGGAERGHGARRARRRRAGRRSARRCC